MSRVVATIWYGDLVDAVQLPAPRRTYAAQLAAGFRVFRASRRADLIVTSEGRLGPPGIVVLAGLLALTRSRRLALFEFLAGRKTGVLGRAVATAYRLFLRRACVFVQAMTEHERVEYQAEYRIPDSVIQHVPYFFLDDRVEAWSGERAGIFASGHQSCDWDGLLDAAEGQDWPLTIVCSAAERARIADRAARAGVAVLSDVPRGEHDRMLARATFCVIPLLDTAVSAGHTRLMSSLSVGTPSILTDVTGTRGYSQLASRLVPPGDPLALRAAVAEALTDPSTLHAGYEAARARAQKWARTDYSERIRGILLEILTRQPETPAAGS